MTAQAALKAVLRDVVGPAARAAGFKGSGVNWRLRSPAGDWAVVNVQSSPWSTAAGLECVINIAVAPAPWLDWLEVEHGGPRKVVSEPMGLYRDRIDHSAEYLGHQGFPGHHGWWRISDDEDALVAARDMVDQLDRHGWPVLTRLLDRSALLSSVRAGNVGIPMGELFCARAEAVLIADDGPSLRLDEVLDTVTALQGDFAELNDLLNTVKGPPFEWSPPPFVDWARARAAAAA